MNTFIIITIVLNLSLVASAIWMSYAIGKLSEPELVKLKELAHNFWNKHLTNNYQRVLVCLVAIPVLYIVAAIGIISLPFYIAYLTMGVYKCL